MDRRRGPWYRLHIDPSLLSGTFVLCAIGLVVLYSAGGQDYGAIIRQGARMALGLALMSVLAQVPPHQFARSAPWLYGVGLALLVACLFVGTGRGTQRWLDLGIFRFQPAELMKLCVPMTAAWYLNDRGIPPDLPRLLLSLVLIFVPVAMIARQPDLGTAILIAVAGLSVLFFAGMSWRFMGIAGSGVLLCLPLLWYLLHDYQRERLLTLLDPEKDPLGSGYHIIQSKIAVGSGGLYGKGWLNGTQSYLEFLPERSTDFIFAVFCEEFGFMGVLVLLGAYGFVLTRGLAIAMEAQGTFARLLAGSLTLTLFMSIFVNIGMVTGQLPVVGIPLPLISYGGTSSVTLMASLGILMSLQTHRKLLSS